MWKQGHPLSKDVHVSVFPASLFLFFSFFGPHRWELLGSVCVTDDSSADSHPERLRRGAERGEPEQHSSRNVQCRIKGIVKIPIYHMKELKTGGRLEKGVGVSWFCFFPPSFVIHVDAAKCVSMPLYVCVCVHTPKKKGGTGRGGGLCVDYMPYASVRRSSCVWNLWLCSGGGEREG